MKIWSVAMQKGGVGKTTTALVLAGLAAERKQKVLLVDMDPHGSLSAFFRLDPDRQQYSTFSLFAQRQQLNELLLRRCLCQTNQPNLYLLPSSSALASIDRQPQGADGMGQVLRQGLFCIQKSLIQQAFDLVVVDGPPMAGVLLVNTLFAADKLIIPVQTEYLALQGLWRTLNTLAAMNESLSADLSANWNVPPYLIVPTLHDRRTHASASTLSSLEQDFEAFIRGNERHQSKGLSVGQVWHSPVATDTKLRDAMESAKLPHRLGSESSAVAAYSALLDELLSPAPGRTTDQHKSSL